MLFYMAINPVSLSPIATTELEQHFGFSYAFALPMLVFFIGFGILFANRHKFSTRAPEGSVMFKAFKVMWIALQHHGNLDAAKASYRGEVRPAKTR